MLNCLLYVKQPRMITWLIQLASELDYRVVISARFADELEKIILLVFTSCHVFYRTRRRNWDLSFSLSILSCNFNNYTKWDIGNFLHKILNSSWSQTVPNTRLNMNQFGKCKVKFINLYILYTTNLIASLSFLSPMLSMSRMLYSLLAAARASFAFLFSSRSCSLRFLLDSFFFFLVKYYIQNVIKIKIFLYFLKMNVYKTTNTDEIYWEFMILRDVFELRSIIFRVLYK